jgi:hypothetical protein
MRTPVHLAPADLGSFASLLGSCIGSRPPSRLRPRSTNGILERVHLATVQSCTWRRVGTLDLRLAIFGDRCGRYSPVAIGATKAIPQVMERSAAGQPRCESLPERVAPTLTGTQKRQLLDSRSAGDASAIFRPRIRERQRNAFGDSLGKERRYSIRDLPIDRCP